jgi:hypothetical protein
VFSNDTCVAKHKYPLLQAGILKDDVTVVFFGLMEAFAKDINGLSEMD